MTCVQPDLILTAHPLDQSSTRHEPPRDLARRLLREGLADAGAVLDQLGLNTPEVLPCASSSPVRPDSSDPRSSPS